MRKIIPLIIIAFSLKSFSQITYRVNLEAAYLSCGCSSLGGESFYAYDASNNVIPAINFDNSGYPIITFETNIKPSKVIQVGTCEPTGDDFCYPFPYGVVSQVIFDNWSNCEYKTSVENFGLRANVQEIGSINNIGCITSLSCSGDIERWEVKKPGSNIYEIIPNSKVNTLNKTYAQIYSDNSGINTTTYFRAKFTGTQVYTYHPFIFIPCSPNLDNISDPNLTTCNYSNGEVIFTFSRPIATGEKYLFNRNIVGSNFVTSATSDDSDVEKISLTTFKWKNIPQGNYQFKFQTQFENKTPSTLSPITTFTITPREQLTFTLTDIQPQCSSDNGGVIVNAKGGTSPYYYILNNESKKLLIKNPETIILTTDGVYKVIVVDSNNCIEK